MTKFVQTDLATHELWAQLSLHKPAAAALLHKLVVLADNGNTVVASHAVLAEELGVSVMTIRRAIATLQEGNWLEASQIGGSGTVNAYTLDSSVAWKTNRNGLKYAKLKGTIVLSGQEQKGKTLSAQARKLNNIPAMYPDEQQMPSGAGLPPPSQPNLPSLEPALPATRKPMYDPYTGQRLAAYDPETGELLD